ncbi:MAG: lactamase [Chloroflexi bacterium]|nr:MAG: lactamase [Chloroflexota bacterium]
MQIRILGAHMTEIASAKLPGLLIDGVLALDAGSLCSSLPLEAQRQIKAIFLTHHHYDHVRDLPTLAMNLANHTSVEIYCIQPTSEVLSTHLFDGGMYPNFLKWPDHRPAIRFTIIKPYQLISVASYSVVAIPVAHVVPTVGFQVSSAGGKSVFYTGDTSAGLDVCWEHVHPDLLVTEITMPQRLEDWARKTGHLAPGLLKAELLQLRKLNGYIPRTVLVHVNPSYQSEVEREVATIAEELGADISLGYEGLTIDL